MKYSNEKINDILNDLFINKNIVKCVFSNMKGNSSYSKIIIKPLIIKGEYLYQFEQFKDNKAYHSNLPIEEAIGLLSSLIENFYQYVIFTKESQIQIIKNKKDFSFKEVKSNKNISTSLSHNKVKNYILEEGKPIPFLVKLGVMGDKGEVFKHSYNKFKQINKYLEFIEGTINELQSKKLIDNHIKIIDFGCGKSYLTFALHYYLENVKKLSFDIIGLDLKKDVIATCSNIVSELSLKNIEFLTGDIKDFNKLNNVDIIFSLHACNNATDYAILKGLQLNAKAILAVPCCQHEFYQKISANKESSFFKMQKAIGEHGILLEKFSAIATDAFRGKALELCGYNTQIMEFIDMEHTPKNILIKSILGNKSQKELEKKLIEYNDYKEFLGIEPLLESLLKPYFIQ